MRKYSSLKSTTIIAVVTAITVTIAGCSTPASTAKPGANGRTGTRQMTVETQVVKLSDIGGGQVLQARSHQLSLRIFLPK